MDSKPPKSSLSRLDLDSDSPISTSPIRSLLSRPSSPLSNRCTPSGSFEVLRMERTKSPPSSPKETRWERSSSPWLDKSKSLPLPPLRLQPRLRPRSGARGKTSPLKMWRMGMLMTRTRPCDPSVDFQRVSSVRFPFGFASV